MSLITHPHAVPKTFVHLQNTKKYILDEIRELSDPPIDSKVHKTFKVQKRTKNSQNISCVFSGSTVILWSYENSLVMSFWLKVCIYSHTRGVKLGLGLGFMQTSQVLPHWLNQSFSFWTLPYTQRHCHVRIEKSPVQTVTIILEAHNFLEYHYML